MKSEIHFVFKFHKLWEAFIANKQGAVGFTVFEAFGGYMTWLGLSQRARITPSCSTLSACYSW